MKIGIIGAGHIGGALARHLSRLGHSVSISNSRGPDTLASIALETNTRAVSVEDAVKDAELIIMSIPQKAVEDLPTTLFALVPRSVPIVDTGNYYPELRDGRIQLIENGMIESRWVEQQIGRPVIKAFNNIYAESLRNKASEKGTKERIALSVFGDSQPAKNTVLLLIDDIGFDAVDGGELDFSWQQQPGMPSYCNDLEAHALKLALSEAEKHRLPEARIEQEELTRQYLTKLTN